MIEKLFSPKAAASAFRATRRNGWKRHAGRPGRTQDPERDLRSQLQGSTPRANRSKPGLDRPHSRRCSTSKRWTAPTARRSTVGYSAALDEYAFDPRMQDQIDRAVAAAMRKAKAPASRRGKKAKAKAKAKAAPATEPVAN